MVKHLSTKHPDTSLYLHVDDISTLTEAKWQRELGSKDFEWAWGYKQCTDDLKLDISDKSVAVPICQAAENFTKGALATRPRCVEDSTDNKGAPAPRCPWALRRPFKRPP